MFVLVGFELQVGGLNFAFVSYNVQVVGASFQVDFTQRQQRNKERKVKSSCLATRTF